MWPSTMPGLRPCTLFQSRTVDAVIAAMEARYPHLMTPVQRGYLAVRRGMGQIRVV